MGMETARTELAKQIAGEIVTSENPGATMRKWRTDFEVTQTDLADELEVSSSVISDYESGRRESPGIEFVRRLVEGLLTVDDRRGGHHIRQFDRILSAGLGSDVVHDLREYQSAVPLTTVYEAIEATEVSPGGREQVLGHTVIDSVEAIIRLSSEEFYRLYGQSTSRVLVFTGITRGESPLVALRVVTPTPDAVVLHGLDRDQLWEHAPTLARIDGYSLAVTDAPLEDVLSGLRSVA